MEIRSYTELAAGCRCDCASCAEGDHLGCYYRTREGAIECPVAAFVERKTFNV